MATRTLSWTAYGTDGVRLAGLSPTWGCYFVNGVAATGPAIAELGSGKYEATIVLAAGERLSAQIVWGETFGGDTTSSAEEAVSAQGAQWAAEDAAIAATPAGIAEEILNSVALDFDEAGTVGEILNNLQAVTAHRMKLNKATGVITVYAADGSTTRFQMQILDDVGNPSALKQYDRVPV